MRIGKVDGNFVVNPNEEDLLADENSSDLDLIVAGTEDAILMVEAGANEIPEAEILDALDIAHAEIKKLCALQRELAAKVGKEKKAVEPIARRRGAARADPRLARRARSTRRRRSRTSSSARTRPRPSRRRSSSSTRRARARGRLRGAADAAKERRAAVQLAFDKLEKSIIRERIAVHKKRPDGRAENEIRDISIEVGVTPRTHGSALFTRGQTQALSVVAIGTLKEEMRLDTLGLETKKYYFHHYNFPPFSVGEAGRMGGAKRRDIGHGALAERALVPMVPSIEEFPYSIRVVSDILESNGSSSMASVCGSSLSLMDAGVPIKRPVAGIAMGLIKEGDDYIVLTDIAGVEDHLGDMDFKVAGTERGITALQMDIKITGVTFEILRDALAQAKEARTFILGKMADVIETPREQLSQFAPRIQTIQIDPSQIGLLIGKGGETIRGLSEEFESQIDVNDDGQVLIYSANGELGDALVERDPDDDEGGRGRRRVRRQGRQDDHLRRLRRALQGHRRAAAHLQRLARRARRHRRGRAQQGRRDRRARGGGRPRARPHRPAPRRRPDIAGKSVEELAGVGTGGGGGGGRRDRARAAAPVDATAASASRPARRDGVAASAAPAARATAASATDRTSARA